MSIATFVPSETGAALSTVPALRHGFFGRVGGVSPGPYQSLNMSESGGDRLDLVTRNRAIATRQLGFSAETLLTLAQVHGSHVVTVTEPAEGERPEADALVTRMSGVVLGILTADCAPVLLVDPEARVIGAAHAGWKGALSGVIGKTIEAMERIGAQRGRIMAAIGPTIAAGDYEVGESFRSAFLGHDPEAEPFFQTPPGGKPHFDLPGYVLARLRASGVATAETVGVSTYAAPERYFSHRYATHQGTVTGRQIALIGWLDASAGALT